MTNHIRGIRKEQERIAKDSRQVLDGEAYKSRFARRPAATPLLKRDFNHNQTVDPEHRERD